MSDIEPEHSSMDQENNYVVEAIVDKRLYNGEVQYLLKWKGFPPEDNTWEPSANLNCPSLLEEFELNHPNGSAHRRSLPTVNTDEPLVKIQKKEKKPKRVISDDLEPEKILGASDNSGEIMFLFKW